MRRFFNKVFRGNSLDLFRLLPDESVNAIISDPMFGTMKMNRFATWYYDWGYDPGNGNFLIHKNHHDPFLKECRRVLVPGGILAWAQSVKFSCYFDGWFGPHRKLTLIRMSQGKKQVSGQMWLVQTREQEPISFPKDKDGVIIYEESLSHHLHPCAKPIEELLFLVSELTKPGDLVFDPFCGLGSTLRACKRLGRLYFGCDLSPNYTREALRRLREEGNGQIY